MWDDTYLCIVQSDEHGNVTTIKISNRKSDIENAKKWQEIIVKNSVQLRKTEQDVRNFIGLKS